MGKITPNEHCEKCELYHRNGFCRASCGGVVPTQSECIIARKAYLLGGEDRQTELFKELSKNGAI